MNYCFITGSGRSGTTFLAKLLNSDNNIYSDHEAIGNREFWLLSWYLGNEYTQEFLKREKLRIDKTVTKNLFVDVNGYLQNATPQLKVIFPNATIFHLVRDPRMVIPSLYQRRNENNIHLIPQDKAGISRWLDEDKFYQVCWNWANCTNNLLKAGIPILQFEKLISDYRYFQDKLLQPLRITISEAQFLMKISHVEKSTKPYWYRKVYSLIKQKDFITEKLPSFADWSAVQKQIFEEVCGEASKQAGY